jgi:hypothetical protein
LYLMTWSDYIDESYNLQTFCVGGLLAPPKMWDRIEASWSQRIAYENRRSAKKGFPPISRYHATDCANLKKEFSENRGWDVRRQILFTKRLCEIIGSNGPCAIVHGGPIAEVQEHVCPGEDAKGFLYYVSTYLHLMQVGNVMAERFPKERVSVFYDRSRQFGAIAMEAFNSFMNDPTAKSVSKYFVTMAPMGWEDCVALQPADLIAYEGMKRVNGSLQGKDEIRKSLRALVGNDQMPVWIEHFTSEAVIDLSTILKNKRDGKPLHEGVKTKLDLWQNWIRGK